MEKYLLSMPCDLKKKLTFSAKRSGYSLNAQILFILNEWLKKQESEV